VLLVTALRCCHSAGNHSRNVEASGTVIAFIFLSTIQAGTDLTTKSCLRMVVHSAETGYHLLNFDCALRKDESTGLTQFNYRQDC